MGGLVFSFGSIWGKWENWGREEGFFRNFCARFLRVGGAFLFQTDASRAQIRNRCVGGEARGKGGRDGGDRKVGTGKARAQAGPGPGEMTQAGQEEGEAGGVGSSRGKRGTGI